MKSWHSILLATLMAVSTAALAATETPFVDSDTVRQVQKILTDRGFQTAVDGMMGPRTQSALKKFQRAENLEPTGQLNRQTLIALGLQTPDAAAAADEPRYSRETIRSVQRTLNNRGFSAGASDGTLNPQTQQALREFQKSENLQDSGRLNPPTLAALGLPEEKDASASAGATRPATASSSTIREMQRRLNARGFDVGAPDGILGTKTREALRDFQRSANLSVTGQPDRRTLDALGMKQAVATQGG